MNITKRICIGQIRNSTKLAFPKNFHNNSYDKPEEEHFSLWKLYPKKVKNWLIYTKTPRGHFDFKGQYFPSDFFAEATEPIFRRPPKASTQYKIVDSDLLNGYRFGIKPEEIEQFDFNPKLKELFSMRNATLPEIHAFRKSQFVSELGESVDDSGRSEVQVACLTVRIEALSEHLRVHTRDKHSAYGLNKLVHRRRKLLQYLKRKNAGRYYKCIFRLQLRDLVRHSNSKYNVISNVPVQQNN
mmetsp:Transcript_20939/g.35637  ORF Transcript_20939/g.35637 Transcript_20939/m.35637 type:complete len:242 (+) Transcript_20939:52-777(+)